MQEFELRNYDARIGRWTTPDPYGQYASPYLGMGNLPHVLLDGNGGWAGCPPICPEGFINVVGANAAMAAAAEAVNILPEIVISGTRIGTLSGLLPSIVVSTMVEIPNGLMFQGVDDSWYASFPTNEGSYIFKHENGDWQMHRNEPYLAKAYGENLRTAYDKIAELYTTLISSALGGFSVSTGLRGAVTQNAAKGGLQYSDDLVRAAQQAYPKLAGKTQLHHITPKYLGGASNGPLVPLDAAYHQQITNAFRQAWPYSQGAIKDPVLRKQIMDQVYKQFLLPPGYGY